MIDIKGIGSEGAIINLVISAFIIYQVYLKPKLMRKQGKERRNNPHPAPGNAEQCKKHIKGLAEVKTEIQNLKDQSKTCDEKNREDHRLIFDKIDRLKNRKQ